MNGTVKKVQVEVRPSGDKTNFVSTKFNNPLKIRGDLTFDLGCYDQDCPMIRSSSELQNVEISDDNKMIYSFKKEIDLALHLNCFLMTSCHITNIICMYVVRI